MRSSPRKLFAVGVVSFALVGKASAQGTTNATCTRNFWTYNDLGQTPCLVWGQLQAVCLQQIIVTPLQSTGYQYYPPSLTGEINDCNCNVVSYNLMAACSWCQADILSNNWVSESVWSSGCTTYDSSGIPSSVDIATIDIPAWAYLPDNGTAWQPTLAQANSTITATTAPAGPTKPPSSSTPGSGSGSSSSHSSSPTNSSSPGSSSSPPVGAIAGGVVGGVAVLALLGLLVFCLMRRRKRAADKRSSTPVDLTGPLGPEPSPYFLPVLGGQAGAGGAGAGAGEPGTPWKAPFEAGTPGGGGGTAGGGTGYPYNYTALSTTGYSSSGTAGAPTTIPSPSEMSYSGIGHGGVGGGGNALGLPTIAAPQAPTSTVSSTPASVGHEHAYGPGAGGQAFTAPSPSHSPGPPQVPAGPGAGAGAGAVGRDLFSPPPPAYERGPGEGSGAPAVMAQRANAQGGKGGRWGAGR